MQKEWNSAERISRILLQDGVVNAAGRGGLSKVGHQSLHVGYIIEALGNVAQQAGMAGCGVGQGSSGIGRGRSIGKPPVEPVIAAEDQSKAEAKVRQILAVNAGRDQRG